MNILHTRQYRSAVERSRQRTFFKPIDNRAQRHCVFSFAQGKGRWMNVLVRRSSTYNICKLFFPVEIKHYTAQQIISILGGDTYRESSIRLKNARLARSFLRSILSSTNNLTNDRFEVTCGRHRYFFFVGKKTSLTVESRTILCYSFQNLIRTLSDPKSRPTVNSSKICRG